MVGAQHGYYKPSDWQSCAQVDVVLDAWVDMLDKSNGIALKIGSACTPEEAMKEHEGVIERVHVPALKVMEAQLTANGGPYIAGNFISIADCAMVAMLVNIWENPAGPWAAQFKPVLA
jgi:hypothetical protein